MITDENNEAAGESQARSRHGQIHLQVEGHRHRHWHGQIESHARRDQASGHGAEEGQAREAAHGHRHGAPERDALAVRSHSGVAGDMLLAGLAALALERDGMAPDSPEADAWLSEICSGIMAELGGAATLRRATVQGIRGWRLAVNLPHAHEHRRPDDISGIIAQAAMLPEARELAQGCFHLLAECEADAHGVALDQVHFHEVGALDSILDICVSCELYARLGKPPIHCGSLPIADGEVHCAHGVLPAPAPAVLRLLRDIPVHPFPGAAQAGELLTPTGLALLKAFKTRFGRWPSFRIQNTTTVYGQKEFAAAPNGLIFALGRAAA